jgi:Fanconi anemia group M protein
VYDNPATNTNIINGALAFISVLNRIPVVFTADPEESADILFMATNQMQFGLGYEVHAEDQRKRKRELREIQHDVLQTLPGIGPNLAKVLLKQFGSLQGVFNATPEALAEVQGFEDGQRDTLIELFTHKG